MTDTLDSVAPEFAEVPENLLSVSPPVTVTGVVRDDRIVQSLRIRTGGGSQQTIEIQPASEVPFSVDVGVAEGIITVTLVAEDGSGNQSTYEVEVERIGFDVVRIESLGGETMPTDLNNLGQVVGRVQMEDGQWLPFLWQDGVMELLDTVLVQRPSYDARSTMSANSINDAGVIVGWDRHLAVEWRDGAVRDLGLSKVNWVVSTVDRAAESAAINEAGLIAASWWDTRYAQKWSGAVVIDSATTTTLDSTISRSLMAATALNDRGEVVGVVPSGMYSFTVEPFLYRDGDLILLEGLTGNSVPRGINEAGQIVGHGYHPDPAAYPIGFFWEARQIQPIGPLHPLWTSEVVDLNEAGYAVGVSYQPGHPMAQRQALLWRAGSLVNLAEVAGDPWQAIEATAINDRREVTVRLRHRETGEIVSALLVPRG